MSSNIVNGGNDFAINTTETETDLRIEQYDPAREIQDARDIQEGIPSRIRSCKSCQHVAVCKIFEVQAIHTERLKELSKRSEITLDITPPEEIGARCGEYASGVTK